MDSILWFSGRYSFLSNFSACGFEWHGQVWPWAEMPFQWAKTNDLHWRRLIRSAGTPREAKALGRNCPLRDDWEAKKIYFMWSILRCKFAVPVLAKMLLDTGDAYLEEGNHHGDMTWGTVDGVGTNYLGMVLMHVRAELQGEIEPLCPRCAETLIRPLEAWRGKMVAGDNLYCETCELWNPQEGLVLNAG